jgi:hypothetical protein
VYDSNDTTFWKRKYSDGKKIIIVRGLGKKERMNRKVIFRVVKLLHILQL